MGAISGKNLYILSYKITFSTMYDQKAKTKTAIIFLPIALMMLQSCCRGGWCSMAGASELASDAVGHVYLNRLTS